MKNSFNIMGGYGDPPIYLVSMDIYGSGMRVIASHKNQEGRRNVTITGANGLIYIADFDTCETISIITNGFVQLIEY